MTSSASPPEVELAPPRPLGLRGVWSRRAMGALMVIILAGYGVDVLLVGHGDWRLLALRGAWCLSMLLSEIRGSPARERWARHVGIVLCTACLMGIVYLVGGVTSPYFPIVTLYPLGVAISLMQEQDRVAVFLCGLVCSVGTGLILLARDYPFSDSLAWFLSVVVTTVLADFLTRGALRSVHAENQARLERTRRESMEALALSEHRRAQSEQLATVGRLASGVAHEINNPLAYVGSNIDFVYDELRAPRELDREALAEVLAETRVGLRHIQQIVADLRGFARMDAREPAACALVDVVADAMKLGSLRLKHVAWLRLDVPVELPEVFVVRQRLVQVVLNLLINAGDALELHPVPAGEIRVTGRAGQGCVILLVEDNGPGFAPQVLPRLFEAFFTTKSVDRGTGLGLNLSRELVTQFGGTLTASNRPEGGACLRLELPARARESDPLPS